MHIRLIVALIALSLVVIFTLQNTEVVEVNFLFWHVSASRGLVLFLVFVSGLLSGWLFRSFSAARKLVRI